MILTIIVFFPVFSLTFIQIVEIGTRKEKLTDEEDFEIKIMMEDLKCNIEKTENYQKALERALESLQSEFSSHLKKEGFVAVASSAALAVSSAGAVYGKQC